MRSGWPRKIVGSGRCVWEAGVGVAPGDLPDPPDRLAMFRPGPVGKIQPEEVDPARDQFRDRLLRPACGAERRDDARPGHFFFLSSHERVLGSNCVLWPVTQMTFFLFGGL